MGTSEKTAVTVKAVVNAPIAKVWEFWTQPMHITKWCYASDDWHAPHAENDLRVGGKCITTMAAKDGSMSFDFEGVYTNVRENEIIEYTIIDGRKIKIVFSGGDNDTKVIETFETENSNPVELQRDGWQAILNNFKKYVEAH